MANYVRLIKISYSVLCSECVCQISALAGLEVAEKFGVVGSKLILCLTSTQVAKIRVEVSWVIWGLTLS